MHWTQIEEHAIGDVMVLRLEGHMTLDADNRGLRRVVEDLISAGHTRMILDLARVPYVDSLGIGEIVRAYAALTTAGGSLRLTGAGPRVRELLETTQLARILQVYETQAEALASLAR